MKKVLILFAAFVFSLGTQALHAQAVESLIDTYLENVGGKKKLAALKTMKLTAKGNAQGMELPVTMYTTANGKQRLDMVFQGQEITQMAFDGKEGWGINFMTGEAEKMDAEQSKIMKEQVSDFPDPFLNYKEKGYTVTLEGEEEVEGTATYKIKLTKKPLMIEGEEVENFSYYYFDKDALVPIMQEDFAKSGPMKGQASQTFTSDYQEVGDGLFMAHSITQKMGGNPVFSMNVETIELNVDIEESFFAFPEAEEAGDK